MLSTSKTLKGEKILNIYKYIDTTLVSILVIIIEKNRYTTEYLCMQSLKLFIMTEYKTVQLRPVVAQRHEV